jgi:AcrR family transcriptional regulator
MARRSTHSPEELRHSILVAAKGIIEREGLVGLTAREIARSIGYSPGTLYNIFENLDDILLTLQTQLLSDLVEVMSHVVISAGATADPLITIDALARAYLEYALANKRMWNLLFTHYLPNGMTAPQALHDNINAVGSIVASLLAPIMPGATRQELDVASRALWAGVHGITAVAVTDKGPTMTTATAHVFVKQLTTAYTRGLLATTRANQ